MTLRKQNRHYSQQLDLTAIDQRVKRLELLTGIQALNDDIRERQMEDRVEAARFLTQPSTGWLER